MAPYWRGYPIQVFLLALIAVTLVTVVAWAYWYQASLQAPPPPPRAGDRVRSEPDRASVPAPAGPVAPPGPGPVRRH